MPNELQVLEQAVADFQHQADLDFVDPGEFSKLVDSLQGTLCAVLHRARKNGQHLLAGKTPTSWVAQTCGLTPSAASDRLCVGEQLASLPRVEQALTSGEISYQSAAVICHFQDRLRPDLRPNIDQEWWLAQARTSSVRSPHWLEQHV